MVNVGAQFIAPDPDGRNNTPDLNGRNNLNKSSLLQLTNVTFAYGGSTRQPLLYDVNLQVQAGEMVGLLGPNGSGKTTLLRLMSGVLRPQHGKILLENRDLQQWGRRGAARHIAVVPQELHMPFAFTVEDMVSLGRTPFISFLGSQGKHDAHIIQQAMHAAEITPLAHRVFNELSGGERQRVMVAMALAQQPKVLLLDEPTSHLDIRYQIDILELAQKLNRETHVTVIAAMHDLNLAARYFPRLLLFQRGIVADGGPAEVLESGLLSRVYGVNVQVGILRGAEHLSVLPPSSENLDREHDPQNLPKVHVIAGGGSGEVIMRALADAAIPFTAGALNIGDSDHTLALRLASHVITEQPYAPISVQTADKVRESLEQASVLILCPTPIGPGNLALLQEAVYAAQRGLPVIVLAIQAHPQNISQATFITQNETMQQNELASRDYTGGAGLQLLNQLIAAGATIVNTVGEAVELAKKYISP